MKGKWATILLVVLAAGCFLGAFFFVLPYLDVRSEKESLDQYVTMLTPEESGSGVGTGHEETLMGNGDIQVDHEGLLNVNPDYIGWLYFPGLGISEPVVQCDNNEYYLKHSFYGKYSDYGTLFLDSGAILSGGNEFINIIYGHNTYTGDMFGPLHTLAQNDVFEGNPTFWLLTPEVNYEVTVSAFGMIAEDDEMFSGLVSISDIGKSSFSPKNSRPSDESSGHRMSFALTTCRKDKVYEQRVVVLGSVSQ